LHKRKSCGTSRKKKKKAWDRKERYSLTGTKVPKTVITFKKTARAPQKKRGEEGMKQTRGDGETGRGPYKH